MAIENVGGAIVITGEEDIQRVRIAALRACLELELAGMKRSGRSAFTIVKEEFNLKGSRAKVYAAFCRMHNLPTKAERGAIRRASQETGS